MSNSDTPADTGSTKTTRSRKSRNNEEKTVKMTDNSDQRTTLQVEAQTVKEPENKGAGTHSGIELYQPSVGLPGNRPIASSKLQICDTIWNRPVTSSNFEILGTMSASGIRPIASSHLQVSATLSISGNRPISASHLVINHTLMNRPISSNQIDDSEGLMGFLD